MSDPDWIYCRVVDRQSFIFPRTPFWFGLVEFSNLPSPKTAEALAVTSSMAAFSIATDSPTGRLAQARLLVPEVPPDRARHFGNFHFHEMISAFNEHLTLGLGHLRPTEAGYLFNLTKSECLPLLPPVEDRTWGVTAMMDTHAAYPRHTLNTLFAAPAAFGQLGDAYRRSLHWQSLASMAVDEGERLLLNWMSAECLCKTSHNENIVPRLLAAAGFPLGVLARRISPTTLRSLTRLPAYRPWRANLTQAFDGLRVARNHIVHSGFRHVDLPMLLTEEQRKIGFHVLPAINRSLRELALQTVNQFAITIPEMWDRYEALINPDGLVAHAQWFIEKLGKV